LKFAKKLISAIKMYSKQYNLYFFNTLGVTIVNEQNASTLFFEFKGINVPIQRDIL